MFQLTRKADYALRLMLEVAGSGGRVSTAAAARRQDIPYQFLRKVAQELVNQDLLVAERGSLGGLSLARAADRISVFDVVSAIDGTALNECTIAPSACDRRDICACFPVWLKAQAAVEHVLRGALLSELARHQRELGTPSAGRPNGLRRPGRKETRGGSNVNFISPSSSAKLETAHG